MRGCVGLHFDLIILDVMMPGQNGYEFAARIRAEIRRSPRRRS